ncbi:MAG: HD domain-containing protein [Bryobacterales bacterium]|nr:HD domain-containing protein [Bryobacterales bacterium]MBV9399138.1 HD domain-containing protein [Bryobacterales bacterium]
MATDLVILPPPPPEAVHRNLAARSGEVETRVLEAFAATLRVKMPGGLALAAVGGFGRRELFPYSDVDLLLLTASDSAMPPKGAISAFLQMLWDGGFRPSHSVHSLDDCVKEHSDNVEFTISLMDRRFLAGDQALYGSLDERLKSFLAKRGAAIAQQIAALAVGRRAKFQGTIYHLEPNIKDTPGGLRDLHTARWLQAIEPRESAPALNAALDFLAGIRIRLHELAGRDQNVLSFDSQDALSDQPASLMREYYRHARVVDRAVREGIEAATEKPGTLIGRFHEWRSRLSTNEFTVSRDRVLLRSHQPPAGLGLFEFVGRHQLRLAPDTLERLTGFKPQTTWADWKRLLGLPKPAAGLRAMQETGALAAALPEWRNIECLVVRDFYHRYTVDEHTLVAIASLESVTDGRFAELFAEIEDPALIRFALLMHDIGKGSGRDHCQVALEVARDVMTRLGAPDADRSVVEFLVERHLEMSSVMTSRDLHDGSTALALAERIGTIERLKLLTMITYADISAVNPQAMTPWRLEQLWRVYLLAHQELTKELETARIHSPEGVSPERARFLEGLPMRYLRIHSSAEIEGHLALARQLESRPVAVEIEHQRGIYKLTLLSHDRPALFASVAGAISSFGLNILKVEAFTNAAGIVVDTFTFADPHRTLELNPTEVERLRGVVRRVLEGKQEAEKLLRGRPKPLLPSKARLKPRVAVKNDVSEHATLIEIVAEDRPGLLYDLARAISTAGCNIEVVLIDTEAHKALDVFYVTQQGQKLAEAAQEGLRESLLAACSATH